MCEPTERCVGERIHQSSMKDLTRTVRALVRAFVQALVQILVGH